MERSEEENIQVLNSSSSGFVCMTGFLFRESNCFMVRSKAEDKIIERMLSGKDPIVVTESQDNVVDTAALMSSEASR